MTQVLDHERERAASTGRLLARPAAPSATGSGGLHDAGLTQRPYLVAVPAPYSPSTPLPLVVMLHGAGGDAPRTWASWQPFAEAAGAITIIPSSRRTTWDIIADRRYGADVVLLDQALAYVFNRYAVDPAHIIISGFSDGASYALSIGLANGDLWTHIVAFSPGFMAPATHIGTPQVFISHGTHDRVLPIDRCSRRIVPQLRADGYAVTYHEFDDGHTVPPSVAHQALHWLKTTGDR